MMMYRLAALLLLATLATACETWTADPNQSTEVELSDDLSQAQVVAAMNAVLEINAAVGREVFHLKGEHPGFRGHVTVTTRRPSEGHAAQIIYRPGGARIHLGSTDASWAVQHELIHAILGEGEEHSDDPYDIFYGGEYIKRGASITDPTLARILARMDD